MTSRWERFQQLNGAKRSTTQAKVNAEFIYKGYPSVEITNTYTTTGGQKVVQQVQAVVVNLQEKDEAYIYTASTNALNEGSICAAKTLQWLITEEIITIKDVNWHKYHCFLCNVTVGDTYGYFIGPEKNYIKLTLSQNVIINSNQKPVLILPKGTLKVQDKIMIQGRAWEVTEYDSISKDAITYYSLVPTTMSKEVIDAHSSDDGYIESYEEPYIIVPTDQSGTSAVEIAPGAKITISTKDGYFKSSINSLTITKHTGTEVIFSVPYGVETFTVQTKNTWGTVQTTTYKVVS